MRVANREIAMGKKTALVLGATGMVGEPLTRALLQDGWKVYGAARLRDPARAEAIASAGCELIRFDVTTGDPAALPDVDVLFLDIWDPARPDLLWAINFYGIGRVVERYAGIANVVNGSTINVYGDGPTAPREDAPCRPTSEYGRSRYAQERLIDYFSVRGGRSGIHVRYAHANTARSGIIRSMAESILQGQSLGPHPNARIQAIGLEDFVRITKDSVRKVECPPTAVNCCHPRVWTRRQLAEEIQNRLGHGTVTFDREAEGVEHSVYADVGRMIEWFGEPQVSMDTLLERVVAEFR
jgi:nucleoside-diphosphate-sugar epimerase